MASSSSSLLRKMSFSLSSESNKKNEERHFSLAIADGREEKKELIGQKSHYSSERGEIKNYGSIADFPVSQKGYAIVYSWKSRCGICSLCGCGADCCRIGHVSMQLCRENGTPFEDEWGYISIWPAPNHNLLLMPLFKKEEAWALLENTIGNTYVIAESKLHYLNKRNHTSTLIPILQEKLDQLIQELGVPSYESKTSFLMKNLSHKQKKLMALKSGHRVEAEFMQNLTEDMTNENIKKLGKNPTKTYKVMDLDVGAIRSEFKKIKSTGIKWSILGAGLFKKIAEVNCSGLIAELLLTHGGLDNHFKKVNRNCYKKFLDRSGLIHIARYSDEGKREFSAPPPQEYERAEDIMDVTFTRGSCGEYTKRVMSPLPSLLIAIGMMYYAYTCWEKDTVQVGVGRVVLGEVHGHWATAILLLLAMSILTYCHDIFSRAAMSIGNCGGVSPDDIDFFLNYLSLGNSRIIDLSNSTEPRYHIPPPAPVSSNEAIIDVLSVTPKVETHPDNGHSISHLIARH